MILYGKPRYLGILKVKAEDYPSLVKGVPLVVETTRGRELGIVAGPVSAEQEERYRRVPSGEQGEGGQKAGMPTEEVALVGFPLPEELDEKEGRLDEESDVLMKAREMLKSHNLPMKLVDVEYLLDRSKLFFYFTADQRIDFRGFVRDLAREFKTRIELRQIGGRDEAKVAGGLSQCGMPCCCSHWLNRFEPICIKMVKQQNLALNPTKISGICGRLMCCMGYEHTTYQELWKGLPNPGTKLKSPTGETYLISGVDLMGRSVRVFCPSRTELLVPVGEFQKFKECIQTGEPWEPQREEVVPLPFDELLREAVTEGETIVEDGACPVSRPSRNRPPQHQSGKDRISRRVTERITREVPEAERAAPRPRPSVQPDVSQAEQPVPKKKRPRRKKRKTAPGTVGAEQPRQEPVSEPTTENRTATGSERPPRKRNPRRRRPRKPSSGEQS